MADIEDDRVVLRHPRDIRALVHPARLVVVNALYGQNRQLTATEAARLAGITPSAMSYHLRALERAGIAKRAEASADGRERPWVRAAAELTVRLDEEFSYAASAATAALLEATMEQDRRGLLASIERRQQPERILALDGATRYERESLVLTVEEALTLTREIFELLKPFQPENRAPPPEGTGSLTFSLAMFPDPDVS